MMSKYMHIYAKGIWNKINMCTPFFLLLLEFQWHGKTVVGSLLKNILIGQEEMALNLKRGDLG